jgi:hypothetical protein
MQGSLKVLRNCHLIDRLLATKKTAEMAKRNAYPRPRKRMPMNISNDINNEQTNAPGKLSERSRTPPDFHLTVDLATICLEQEAAFAMRVSEPLRQRKKILEEKRRHRSLTSLRQQRHSNPKKYSSTGP